MDNLLPNELEELILCSCCHLMFNDTDALPKLFSCRHYFCLKCVNTILLKGKELYCIHCWKRTELPQADMKPDTLPTYNAILYLSQNMMNIKAKKLLSQSSTEKNQFSSPTNLNLTNRTPRELVCIIHAIPESLWCTKCNTHVCRACASTEEHRNHTVKSQNEAKESIHNDILSDLMKMQKKLGELQHLVFKQRDFLLKILESCTTLKTQIETELINHLPTLEISDIRSHLAKAKLTLTLLENQQSPAEAYKLFTSLHVEKQRLSSKYNEMLLQCKLDDLIQHYGSLLDFDLLKQITTNLNSGIDTLTLINNNNNSLNGNTSSTTGNQNPSLNCNRTFMNLGHNNLVLLLANYSISQLYSHHILTTKTMANLSSGASISGSPVTSTSQSNSNNNNNSMFLSGLGVAGMMADQYQLTSSMQEHLLQKYSELSTSPSNHSSYLQSSDLVGNGSVVTGAGSYVSVARSRPTASQLQLQTPPPHSSQTTVPFISDLNGISMPITIMQHNLQHSSLHLHQGTSSIVSTNVTTSTTNSQATTSIVQNPTVHVYPIFFFDIEINGNPFGRILIEVRNDVAPKMSKNFSSLATMELGYGYKGCNIFQCWENESIITGDFELNNGRGGRSVFEESFFMPDDTKILAIRGSVGMRRSQKRHDNMGLVGSQFRIILREMRGFTGIFAFVVEGLDLVDKISKTGDSAGKPQSNVIIVNCGKWQ